MHIGLVLLVLHVVQLLRPVPILLGLVATVTSPLDVAFLVYQHLVRKLCYFVIVSLEVFFAALSEHCAPKQYCINAFIRDKLIPELCSSKMGVHCSVSGSKVSVARWSTIFHILS